MDSILLTEENKRLKHAFKKMKRSHPLESRDVEGNTEHTQREKRTPHEHPPSDNEEVIPRPVGVSNMNLCVAMELDGCKEDVIMYYRIQVRYHIDSSSFCLTRTYRTESTRTH